MLMKKFLMILAILFLIGVVVSMFLPVSIHATLDGDPDAATELKDPHFHTGSWTTCMNEINQACNK